MAEQDRIEQLDAAIEAMHAGRRSDVADAELRELLAIASDLREVANPEFKAMLKWKVVPRIRHTINRRRGTTRRIAPRPNLRARPRRWRRCPAARPRRRASGEAATSGGSGS